MSGPLPLLSLRAFVEVGRTSSMKDAAGRLGVTPGAVSQQIKALETRLGLALFERLNRELRLTAEGRHLLDDLSEPFRQIEQAVDRVHARHRTNLLVTTTGAFAATWLVPRLGRFTKRHPDIEIRIHTGPAIVPLGSNPGDADIAIRHGLGDWPNLTAEPLLRPRLVPVGSPDLLAGGQPIRHPRDCLEYPLLQDEQAVDWPLWLRAMGCKSSDPRATKGSRFADSTLLCRAAVAGQGLALLRDTYVQDEIAAGRLRIALDAPWPADFAYYVVTRPSNDSRWARIDRFRAWLFEETADGE
ncbi:MAG TPA: LysR substrate-binding domain-containing protein [Rhodopila sp.]|jgi:LysR family glycine cleavage system transcriptional activator|nr:LysR substrate-binding domain-containing protein [Rhodopila sp.]